MTKHAKRCFLRPKSNGNIEKNRLSVNPFHFLFR